MPAKIKFTDEQEKEICRLYNEEIISSIKLAKMFSVCGNTIIKCLRNNNIKISDKKLTVNPGDKFGRWTIINEAEKRGIQRYFLCECSCPLKTRKEVGLAALRKGHSSSCGCIVKENGRKRFFGTGEDFTGQTFGRLTILSEVERSKNGNRQVMAKCSCDGNIDKYILQDIKNKKTTSCGCYKIEVLTHRKKDYEERHPLFCQVEEIMDDPNGPGILTRCKKCNKWYKPTGSKISSRIDAIENPQSFAIGRECNLYCSDECKYTCPLFNLKSDPFRDKIDDNTPIPGELTIWANEIFFRQFQEYGYNFCTKCQSTENLAAHHIDPKKIEPFFALDPENGIIFCRDCHHDDGHSGECSTGFLAYKVCKK